MGRRLYISFAAKDHLFRDALVNHLASLENIEVLDSKSESVVTADQREARLALLRSADVILVILSARYFADPECREHDMPCAVARRDVEGLDVVPIVALDVVLAGTPFADRRVLPSGNKRIGTPRNDKVWTEVVRELGAMLTDAPRAASKKPAVETRRVAARGDPPGAKVELDGRQKRALREALVRAFDPAELEMLVSDGMSTKLPNIVAPGSHAVVTFRLVEWAEQNHRVADLLRAAVEDRPNDPVLKELAREIGRVGTSAS